MAVKKTGDHKHEGKRKCMKCGKWIVEGDGVKLVRGLSFMCKSCYAKEKKKQKKDKAGESCEFC